MEAYLYILTLQIEIFLFYKQSMECIGIDKCQVLMCIKVIQNCKN